MKKLIISAFVLAATAATFATPAFADRTVMVMVQEMPMTGTPPTQTYPVMVEVQMNATSMAAMKAHLNDGSMTLVCMPSGPTIMMCHGK
jgi:hypothetical protein